MRAETISLFGMAAALCAVACSPSDENGAPAASRDAGSVECPVVHATRPCDDCGQGRQVCRRDHTWGPCECAEAGPADGGAPVPDAGPSAPPSSREKAPPAGNTRTGITFQWPETEPDRTSGSCQAGTYTGSFNVMYTPGGMGFGGQPGPVQVIGNFDFTLVRESSNGEIFEITGGTFTGMAAGFVPFEADLQGTLDCAAATFEGMLVNGSYVAGLVMGQFRGSLGADYDKQASAFLNGAIELMEPTNGGHGSGTWQATYAGP